jgi:hypothetical protein
MQRWQNKIRRLRQYLRGWAQNMNGAYKKEKQELMRKAEELDKLAESQLLSQRDWDLKQSIHERLNQLLTEEELKWFQRAKTTKILKGDNNTKYFQMIANGKRRKTMIFRLEQEEGVVEGRSGSKNLSQSFTKISLDHRFLVGLRSMSRWWRIFLKLLARRMRRFWRTFRRRKLEKPFFN